MVAWRAGGPRLAGGFVPGLLGLVGLYAVALVAVSVASQRHVLAPGEIKRFCGLYLDCHLGVSVDAVRTAATVGDPERLVRAKGTFQIVTLRVSSDARRATLSHRDRVVPDRRRGQSLPQAHAAEPGALGPGV
jgi:hypothetical protein